MSPKKTARRIEERCPTAKVDHWVTVCFPADGGPVRRAPRPGETYVAYFYGSVADDGGYRGFTAEHMPGERGVTMSEDRIVFPTRKEAAADIRSKSDVAHDYAANVVAGARRVN